MVHGADMNYYYPSLAKFHEQNNCFSPISSVDNGQLYILTYMSVLSDSGSLQRRVKGYESELT